MNTLKGHYSPVTYLSVWKMKVLSVSQNAIKLWQVSTNFICNSDYMRDNNKL